MSKITNMQHKTSLQPVLNPPPVTNPKPVQKCPKSILTAQYQSKKQSNTSPNAAQHPDETEHSYAFMIQVEQIQIFMLKFSLKRPRRSIFLETLWVNKVWNEADQSFLVSKDLTFRSLPFRFVWLLDFKDLFEWTDERTASFIAQPPQTSGSSDFLVLNGK